jgi:SAM-dependent methyltransferase
MSDPYAELADCFANHYATLRGQVRQVLAANQLARHAPAPPATVADVGGGAGSQSIRLARLGHTVDLLDPSERMLTQAREALRAEDSSVQARVRLVQGYGEAASTLLGRDAFDVVVCHGVIMYVVDPGPLIAALGIIAKPGALVSLITKNAAALAMRPALEGRFGEALNAFEATSDVGGMGVPTRAHSLAQLEAWLSAAGCEFEAWYGIRVFTDHLGSKPAGDDVADVLAAEWEAGRRDPYRQVARLLHVLARKRPAGR